MYLLISDLHCNSPAAALKREKGCDKVVFLGDYGSPEVFNEARRTLNGMVVIGNHDSDHAAGVKLYSGDDGPIRWKPAKAESRLVLEMVRDKKFNIEEVIEGRKVLFNHGTLVDNHLGEGELWGFLDSKTLVDMNFLRMKDRGIWVMFRGHDHMASIYSFDKESIKIPVMFDIPIPLAADKMHIVTLDNYSVGRYGLFDEKNMTFTYRSIYG